MTTKVSSSIAPFANLHQDLIDLCKTGDQRAQFRIYKLYYKAMYNTSLRIVNNPVEAEDIMQESFLSAFENINTYSGTASFGAWLKKIVINRSLDFLKRDKRMVLEDIDSLTGLGDDSGYDLSYEEETIIKANKVKEAIEHLPDGCRIVMSLHLLDGYDHEEISEILSISPVTSRSQFSRARQKLIAVLKGQPGFAQTQSIA
jgi:RNA polymerase sigma-70 factor (ECF subfamily)